MRRANHTSAYDGNSLRGHVAVSLSYTMSWHKSLRLEELATRLVKTG
jgi:hypothetical protein